jgi:hypothetical protein
LNVTDINRSDIRTCQYHLVQNQPHYVVNSYDFMIFHEINGQKARFETGKSPSLTEWVIPWPNGIYLTGDYAFGPAVSNKFQNRMGDGARLIFKTGPDPVLKRSFCHLLANGLIGPAYLSDRLWAIMQPILCGRGPITYGPSLRMGDDPFSDRHRALFPNALRY